MIILTPENIEAEFIRNEADGIVVKYSVKIDDQTVDKFEFRPPGSYRKQETKQPEESVNDAVAQNTIEKKRGNPNWKKKEDK
jgi:hypothetical protein